MKNSEFGRFKAQITTIESCGEFTKMQGRILEKLFNEEFAKIFNMSMSDKEQHPAVISMCQSIGINLRIDYGS